ncbi:MAG: hypothetical protein RIS86_1386 [Planctomycetota bacterium]|jgi:hypothetical protein
MPRRASYALAAVRALPASTAYASDESTRRQMLAVEALIPAIDADAEYALSETLAEIFRVPIAGAAGQVVLGSVLVGDLSTLVLDLSARLSLASDERPGGAATPEELAGELGIASKTLQRWRRAGLCAHWIVEGGKPRVAIYREALRAFGERHELQFERARNFRRFAPSERAELLAEGRERLAEGLSLNLAAKEVAARHGRSHEGVRLLFLREFGHAPTRRRSGSESAAAFAERAWRFAIEPARIAARLQKSESFVRSLVDRRRAEILRGVQPAWVDLPTFDLPGADETVPMAPAARRLQPMGLVDGDLVAAIESARSLRRLLSRDVRAATERDETRAAAMHYLLRRASRAIDALPRWPDRSRIDEIETDLRTALRLRTLLVERGLVIAFGRADHFYDGGPERLPSDELRTLARGLRRSVLDTVAGFDPSRQRFDRAVSLACDYVLAQQLPVRRPTRAAARHRSGVPERLLAGVAQWQGLVDVLAHRADRIEAEIAAKGPWATAARLVSRRYGFAGLPPRTIEALAAEDRTTVALMTKRVREAEATVRAQ